MDMDFRKRAMQFVQKSISNLDAAAASLDRDRTAFDAASTDYVETVKTYIEARQQYIGFLEKYQDTDKTGPVLASFPGIESHLPTYAPDEMRKDTKTMQELTKLIKDLASKISMLEEQMRRAASRLASGTQNVLSAANQSSTYLDQIITGMDSVYDVGMLS